MSVRIQKQKLQMIADDFYRGTGIQLSVLDAERVCIASAGLFEPHFCDIIQGIDNNTACRAADKYILDRCTLSRRPEMHICHAGLIDIAVPLIYEERICGFLIMGRMRRDISFDDIGVMCTERDEKILRSKYDGLPIYSEERAMSILSLASMLASYIMTEDMMIGVLEGNAELIVKYIREDLHRDISVGTVCKRLGISKNTLNRIMNSNYGMSFGEYVTHERIRLAKRLLLHTEDTVAEISEQVGIPDPSYFCRVFKKHTGVSPLKYRRTQNDHCDMP